MLHNKLWELIAKKLSGEADAKDLAKLEELLRENPDMHYPMQTVADLWHHSTPDAEDAQQAFIKHTNRMKAMGINVEPTEEIIFANPVPVNKKKYLLFSLAAIVIALLGFYFHSIVNSPAPALTKSLHEKNEISTEYGTRTNLHLPDGSQVWLNSGSKLSYDKTYGNGAREVVLSGEAYFDVVKNPALPFIIHTSSINIKVLGTAFNVKSYPGEKNSETTLVRGSLEVTLKNKPSYKIILKPSEKLIVANEDTLKELVALNQGTYKTNTVQAKDTMKLKPFVSHLTYEPRYDAVLETSWKDDKLIFRSETFEDLAVKMERWYGISIRFSDEDIKSKKLNGIFENESIQKALEALQLIAAFDYKMNKNEVVISSKPVARK